MIKVKVTLLAVLIAASSSIFAEAAQGTPQEQAACRPDVRRFCHSVKTNSSGGYLSCLQANRSKLSKACKAVLTNHGV